jgi:hypothetical protein
VGFPLFLIILALLINAIVYREVWEEEACLSWRGFYDVGA